MKLNKGETLESLCIRYKRCGVNLKKDIVQCQKRVFDGDIQITDLNHRFINKPRIEPLYLFSWVMETLYIINTGLSLYSIYLQRQAARNATNQTAITSDVEDIKTVTPGTAIPIVYGEAIVTALPVNGSVQNNVNGTAPPIAGNNTNPVTWTNTVNVDTENHIDVATDFVVCEGEVEGFKAIQVQYYGKGRDSDSVVTKAKQRQSGAEQNAIIVDGNVLGGRDGSNYNFADGFNVLNYRFGLKSENLVALGGNYKSVTDNILVNESLVTSDHTENLNSNAEFDVLRVNLRINALYTQKTSSDEKTARGTTVVVRAVIDGQNDNNINDVVGEAQIKFDALITESYNFSVDFPRHIFKTDFDLKSTESLPSIAIQTINTTAENTTTGIYSNADFVDYQFIGNDKFSYPYLFAFNTIINGQYFENHQPEIKVSLFGKKVKVPTALTYGGNSYTYNGSTRYWFRTAGGIDYVLPNNLLATANWGGTFASGITYTNNPAWVLYDIVTEPRFSVRKYIDTTDPVFKQQCFDFSIYCDKIIGKTITDEYGAIDEGVDWRYSWNGGIYQNSDKSINVLQEILKTFNAYLIASDEGIRLFYDHPRDTVAIFDNSVVVNGKFVYSYALNTSKITAVNVTYTDLKDYGNKKTTSYINNADVFEYGYLPYSTEMGVCTNELEAQRYAKSIYYTNKHNNKKITFTAAIAFSYLEVGDIIAVHDEHIQNVKYSGRILSSSVTTSNIKLNIDTTLPSNRTITKVSWYDAKLGLKTVTSGIGIVNKTITITDTIYTTADLPFDLSNYALEVTDNKGTTVTTDDIEESEPELYYVTDIKFNRGIQISGILYNANKYNFIETGEYVGNVIRGQEVTLPELTITAHGNFIQNPQTIPYNGIDITLLPSGNTNFVARYQVQIANLTGKTYSNSDTDAQKAAQDWVALTESEMPNLVYVDTVSSINNTSAILRNATNYILRARAISIYPDLKTEWVYYDQFSYLGKTAPPAGVDGITASVTKAGILTVTFNPSVSVDARDYTVSIINADNSNFSDAALTNIKTKNTQLEFTDIDAIVRQLGVNVTPVTGDTENNLIRRVKVIVTDTSNIESLAPVAPDVYPAFNIGRLGYIPDTLTAAVQGEYIVVNWEAYVGTFNLSEYRVVVNGSENFVVGNATNFTYRPRQAVNSFAVTAFDIFGRSSPTKSHSITIAAPKLPLINGIDIDAVNSTQLLIKIKSTTQATNALPIHNYRIYEKEVTVDMDGAISPSTGLEYVEISGQDDEYIRGIKIGGNMLSIYVVAVNHIGQFSNVANTSTTTPTNPLFQLIANKDANTHMFNVGTKSDCYYDTILNRLYACIDTSRTYNDLMNSVAVYVNTDPSITEVVSANTAKFKHWVGYTGGTPNDYILQRNTLTSYYQQDFILPSMIDTEQVIDISNSPDLEEGNIDATATMQRLTLLNGVTIPAGGFIPAGGSFKDFIGVRVRVTFNAANTNSFAYINSLGVRIGNSVISIDGTATVPATAEGVTINLATVFVSLQPHGAVITEVTPVSNRSNVYVDISTPLSGNPMRHRTVVVKLLDTDDEGQTPVAGTVNFTVTGIV